ncbi:type I-E CRISPR-associated protein Cas7/Cse4/CasC [Rothia kristinae]|uniref:type I-E CRISPR-associated protein Cas7/Cse4/CasC n=1 Tax=Rothia kristinae TaxID=37923 RepID=UPI0022E8EC20|nr:type I-E CRISPR-associated protein Cas7/Cse4/CasC [Rothia kristinae]
MSHYLDIHALHTLPPSNINRDDTNAPKTATFGGVTRQRVSSQAWKKAIRSDFQQHLDATKIGLRTKRVVSEIVEEIKTLDADWKDKTPEAENAVEDLLKTAGIKTTKPPAKKRAEEPAPTAGETEYLLFLSRRQIQRIAEAIVKPREKKFTKKEAQNLVDTEHSVDIAMFGRMVATAANFNVDAAVQVAHALGVGASEPEFDYFTAVDDVVARAEETGAGMIGTIQMMSSTLYRYATVDLDRLEENLGSRKAAIEATGAFVSAFISSMPTGKQNTFANRTLPEAVVVSLRDDRPVSWVNAFEIPVPAGTETGRRNEAARKLAEEARNIDAMYDVQPVESWVMALHPLAQHLEGLGQAVNRTQLLEQLHTTLEKTLGEAPQA